MSTEIKEQEIQDNEIVLQDREVLNQQDQSYWGIVKRQFKKNRLAVWSLRMVYFIIFIGLFADFIANDKPLYCKYQGESYFPVVKTYLVDLGLDKWPRELAIVSWKEIELESAVWPPIPYSPTEMDKYNVQYVGPFDEQRRIEQSRWRHWMGTDQIGRDVLAGMVHGTRIAMMVGIIAMAISSIIGIFFGAIAGYFGDTRLKVSRIRLVLNIIFIFLAFYYAFGMRSFVLGDAINDSMGSFAGQLGISVLLFLVMGIIPNILTIPLKRIPFLGKQVTIPADIIVSRLIEILVSIPRLLLILAIVAIAKPSIFLVMVIIGVTSWTGIARFLRGELLKVRSLQYIEAAQSLGFQEARIIFRHAIPNSLTSVLIVIAFGIAGAILIEAGLSFLGIGVQADVVTWGKLLNLSRQAPEAWWLAIFPGFAIFVTVTIFNLLGEGLNDALDPRLKQ
ncbi:MAG: ABC transporter permease [Chitinophagales bacterium]|nr:ABC transporter permease [Chitinophagales bacterium]